MGSQARGEGQAEQASGGQHRSYVGLEAGLGPWGAQAIIRGFDAYLCAHGINIFDSPNSLRMVSR
jgi:hypothetical protein